MVGDITRTLYITETTLFLLSVADIACGPLLVDDGIVIVVPNAPDELLETVFRVVPLIASVMVELGVKYVPVTVTVELALP